MVTKLKSKNYITSIQLKSQVFSYNLRNQRILWYQKNYLQLLYNSTKTSDVKTITLLHENFAAWKFRGFLGQNCISRFRQIDEFRGILILRFEQKIRISRHFNFAVQAKNEKSKWLACLEIVYFYLWWK